MACINRAKGSSPKPQDFLLLGDKSKPKQKGQSANYMKQALRAFAMMHNRQFSNGKT